VWVWNKPSELGDEDMQRIVDQAATGGFNVIYLTIDDYLDIRALPIGPQKQEALQEYQQKLDTFIGRAAQRNIRVDAEAGWRDWAEPGNEWKAYAILGFVQAYNLSHVNRFGGMQYDVEPYLLDTYENDKAGVLTRYVEFVQRLVVLDKGAGLPLTMVVPHFYDAAQRWTPPVTLDGKQDDTYDHLVDLLGTVPGSRIVVMAYRNFAEDMDGAVALAAEEVRVANGKNVKVIVAQEAGNVEPAYVTFFGTSKSQLFHQLASITQAFSPYPAFGGTAVDHLEAYEALQ
jgi:hypothetical protein